MRPKIFSPGIFLASSIKGSTSSRGRPNLLSSLPMLTCTKVSVVIPASWERRPISVSLMLSGMNQLEFAAHLFHLIGLQVAD